MQLARRFRMPAVMCALAVLLCELVSWPYTTMGVCDDMSYILIARKVAETGHIFYNGPTTPFLGWQLYLGALFIKLFGYSLTTVRLSTLLVSAVLAFVLQRLLVRANISERNATVGTLALVLSPLYLVLSVTFMSDIQGLFAVLVRMLASVAGGDGTVGDCVGVFCRGG
jgi:4-amino-4-deoxy-L-arabinose transferase-like glycosyltransferase